MSEGAKVLLGDINLSAVQAGAEHIRGLFPGAEVDCVKCDVSKEEDVKGMVELAVQKWGRLDVMVSRAASEHSEL